MNPSMRKALFISSIPWLLAAGWLCATGSVHAQSNLVLFLSQPGGYIGQGQTFPSK